MKIIGITGPARSGKDTLARFLVEHHGFYRVAFADPIRKFVAEITGLPEHKLLDDPIKEQPINWLDGDVSPRQLMQSLGTEWGRKMVDADLWVAAWAARANDLKREGVQGIVAPDVRFDNEAKVIKERYGIVIRMKRPDAPPVNPHASEAGIDAAFINRTIVNEGPVHHLAHHAQLLAL